MSLETPATPVRAALNEDELIAEEKRLMRSNSRRKAKLTLLLASFTMLGPFSIDTYLPAFQVMQAALPATEVQMQLSLTLYLIGFSIFTLFHGAVSDSVGRKPVIVASLCVHAIGSIGCALAGSVTGLLVFRLLQGMFAGAGFVVGRAIVRDLFDGEEAQRQLSRIQMLFAVAPIIAPILGGWIVAHAPWQTIFWFLAIYAAALAAWAKFGLPESHPPEKRLPLAVKPLVKTYAGIFFNKRFQLLAAIPAINFMGFFVYIAGAPALLLTHLQLTTKDFWMLFVPAIGGITLAAYISGRFAGKLAMRKQVAIGIWVMAFAIVLNVIVSAMVKPNVWVHIAPICIYAFGMSLIAPTISIALLDAFPHARGSVSALQSACNGAMTAAVTALIVAPAQQSLFRFSLVMAITGTIGAVIWLIYARTTFDKSAAPSAKSEVSDVHEPT